MTAKPLMVALVGMGFRGTTAVVADMATGEPLTLVREPTNQFDPNAVQVWGRGMHLGYIKGSQVAPIARALDMKLAMDATQIFPARLANKQGKWPMVEID